MGFVGGFRPGLSDPKCWNFGPIICCWWSGLCMFRDVQFQVVAVRIGMGVEEAFADSWRWERSSLRAEGYGHLDIVTKIQE
jgi:hypothetical protein